jgi:hypothetical protein
MGFYWEITVEGNWKEVAQADFPEWSDEGQTYRGFLRQHLELTEEVEIYESADPPRWIVSWGNHIQHILMTCPRDIIDFIFKLKLSSLHDVLGEAYFAARLVAEVEETLPQARVELRQQRERERAQQRQAQEERAAAVAPKA